MVVMNDTMTPGPDAETADGMTLAKIGRIIDAVRHERYRFKPVKRTYIPKKNGKRRPLGLPSWSDKLVAEVVRLLLEAYYEPQFSARSHGFRPGQGCHTALREVAVAWTGTTWFIEGDISGCFDRLDRQVMLDALGENIHDNRMLRLVSNMLNAGYLEDWVWNPTLSGVPQGGVITPPTMLQNAPIEVIGASHKRVRRHAEHDVDLSVVDFDAADQCANDLAAGRPSGGIESVLHLSSEVLEPADQQTQLALR